ncbi:MAG: trypsin-like peptidase domain-containing protein [Clostridiaceae bacterium]|nr:trypsin-like peptidase domain-containing protein [Clostridiaceae bacterium]
MNEDMDNNKINETDEDAIIYENNNENNNVNENMSYSNETTSGGVNEDIIEDATACGFKEEQSETAPIALENNNYTEVNQEKVKKNKGGMRNKIMSYIIVGAICSTLGGVGSGIVTMNMMKNTNSTNSASESKVATTKSSSDSSAKLITTSTTANLSVPEIVKKVSPAVVAISSKSSSGEGVGTGMIFSETGYILTNYHVISGAQSIKVMLSDGNEVSAKVVNFDEAADVAVIKLPDNTKIPGVAEFGDSDKLEVGEPVVAIGNPLGKELIGSVTTGIVSAVNRQVSIDNKELKFIQTDAAINPGNSGGPLVNSKGQVIGINTAKISSTMSQQKIGVEGLGFAIPINTVKPKMEALIKQILTIGISCRNIPEGTNNIPAGVGVIEVQKDSSAEKYGIKPRDIITKFDGKDIKTVEELNALKNTHNAGDIVKVELVRNEKTLEIDLTLSE